MGDCSLALLELEAGQGQMLEALLKSRQNSNSAYSGILLGSAPARTAALKQVVAEQLVIMRMQLG